MTRFHVVRRLTCYFEVAYDSILGLWVFEEGLLRHAIHIEDDAVNRVHVFRYVSKPWDPDDLVNLLREAVAHQQHLTERHELLNDVRRFLQSLDLDGRPCGEAWEQERRIIVQRIDGLLTAKQ